MNTYLAPWSTSLKIISVLATVFCVGISAFMIGWDQSVSRWLALLPLAIILGSAPFTIRSYTLTPDAILIQRLWWTTRLALDGLKSAEFVPNAMRWSLRTCGNGGLFSFTGFYRNKALGAYRAYVTDLQRTVVLRFSKRTVVISPSEPNAFVEALTGERGLPPSADSAGG